MAKQNQNSQIQDQDQPAFTPASFERLEQIPFEGSIHYDKRYDGRIADYVDGIFIRGYQPKVIEDTNMIAETAFDISCIFPGDRGVLVNQAKLKLDERDENGKKKIDNILVKGKFYRHKYIDKKTRKPKVTINMDIENPFAKDNVSAIRVTFASKDDRAVYIPVLDEMLTEIM